MLKKNNVDVLALFETHASGERANSICRRMGFDNFFKVDAVGQSGGLWLLWKSTVGQVTIKRSTNQFIYATVDQGEDLINLFAVYAAPTASRRSAIWEELKDEVKQINGPVLIGGDFNTIVRNDERTGGNGRLSQDSIMFGKWIRELALIDMGFRGNQFTWKRGRTKNTFIAKRLDHILCCAHTRLKWQEAMVTHMPVLSSDHSPLYVQLCPQQKGDPRRRPFRFEAAWIKHQSFKDLLSNSWNTELSTQEALEGLRVKLRKWNKDVFGDIFKRKDKKLEEITQVQSMLDVVQTNELISKEEKLLKEFDEILEQEETIWFQKSREKWLQCGDRNTKFFHMTTIVRRRRNKIESLRNDEGEWITDMQQLETMAREYYSRLYSMEDVPRLVEKLPSFGFTRLSRDELQELEKPVRGEEVERAVREMGSLKAPGPDGYQPIFYQKCWEIVGTSVIRTTLEFFNSGVLPQNMNEAFLVLIPKISKPEKITQFRPISLCNVLFKVMTKIMVIRLKSVIGKLIGPAQSSFIPGRLIADNIVIVQEAVHSMRRKKGRKGWMLLKLDLEKAYDRIRWDFLQDTLEATNLSAKWRNWIMTCVTNPSMSVLWNGEKTESFKAARGLRQGDPLSPYLFVLCLERLCHQIEMSLEKGDWKPIRLSQGGPKLSHICFADDLILFGEATVAQVRVIRRVLEKFCVASGQKVSLEKSKIYFSKNVSRDLARQISVESGIGVTTDLGKYLGMPILQRRINKETFGEVLERVSTRLAGWKGKVMSLAGRVTLTKAVLSALPTHMMSTIVLPTSTLNQLDKISRTFIWGSSPEKKRQHLVSWKEVCNPKSEGGLGIRSAKEMNKSLIAKLGWRVINDKESLWARILHKKYKVGGVHDAAWLVNKSTWSATWRSIVVGLREVISKGISWAPRDGKLIYFWLDRWLMSSPLIELVREPMSELVMNMKAADLWTEGVGWNMSLIKQYLPENISLRLGGVVLNGSFGTKDVLSWYGNQDGSFTVKSAYTMLCHENRERPHMKALWDRVWQVVAPERIKVFLWLTARQVLMTNQERARRHLADNAMCQVCKGGNETILHVLRDCPAMEGIWTRLVPPSKQRSFFAKTLLEWLYDNLFKEKDGVNGVSWSTTFAMAAWWGWKWRCMNVFGSSERCRDRVDFLRNKAKEVYMAHRSLRVNGHERTRVETMISWTKPTLGWVTVNTDGASKGNPGLATAGGVIRDDEGSWCRGFALNIGICSSPLAELWGVYYGLIIAWDKGFRRVVLEVDSKIVVEFLKTGVSDFHPLSFLVRMCQGFLTRDWLVRVTHVYREANRLADGLANYAFSLQFGLHLFDSAPVEIALILEDDAKGSLYPRLVNL